VLKRLVFKFLAAAVMLIGRKKMATLLEHLSASYARRLNAAEALRFLFDLDNRLYLLQGEMSVAYGNGMHTKHRHTRYHDFFTDRVRDGERVLDIGCGLGAVAHAVAEKTGAQVVAVDLNPGNIATARELFAHPLVTYMVGDALSDIPNEKFDVVILSNVLEHLTERVDFLCRIKEVACPCRFLIRVPMFERDWRVPLKRELGVEWRLDSTHETEYTIETFAAEVDAAGLGLMHMEIRWGEIWCELCVK
jgi:SAM-dependent methyltransferase